MTTIIGLAVTFIAFGVILYFARKAGKDTVRAKASEETIEQVVEATRPVSSDSRERLRARYRRD